MDLNRRLKPAVAIVALVMLAVASVGALAFRQEPVSPALGHASVVAQGVVAISPGDLVWQVTERQGAGGEDPASDRDAGFVVAGSGQVLVADRQNPAALLLPGEAVFSPAAQQDVSASGTGEASWFEIDLVPEGAGARDGETIVYASPAFSVDQGERSIKLVRDVLVPGESTTVIGQNAPVAVLALNGAIQVEATDGSSASLGAGEAGSFSGDVIVRGGAEEPASFVAAVIGEALPEDPPASPAAATPVASRATGEGAISVVTYTCPQGLKPSEATPDTCTLDAKAMILDLIALGGEQPVDLGAPPVRDGLPIWSDLPQGRYGLRAVVLADGFDRFYIPDLEGIGGPPESGYKAAGEAGYLVELTGERPSTRLEVYALAKRARDRDANVESGTGGVRDVGAEPAAAPAGTPQVSSTPVTTRAVARPRRGSITVRVLSCPDPYETWNPSSCVLAASPYDVLLVPDGGSGLTLADAVAGASGSWAWEGLGFGFYVIQQLVLPPGAATYYVPGTEYLSDGSGYRVAVDENAAALVLDIYNLAPAPVLPPPAPALPAPAPETLLPAEQLPAAEALPAVDAAPVDAAAVEAMPIEPAPVESAPIEAAPVEEIPAGGDASIDSDGDSLTDDFEINVLGTNPNLYDSDGDGLSDGDEYLNATGNPLAPDGIEAVAGGGDLAPVDGGGAIDSDGDGLTDDDEFALGTDPYLADTDGDGWYDLDEVNAGTLPGDAGSAPQG
jgi:hypothetical protein